ncbi:ADP-ribosylglycohydrolase family protein [Nocardioides stalactiti]|uniref:ADP-ribosylglycohydrolase family protein n=1 Tax=Nocardioides stalactiti TaxID=2755356 RepID=UPI0016002E83|nr:ADP-ribosylglycohydrolase family protein [Nocardioides stalactiti]
MTLNLTTAQNDRAAGVLLAAAAGDALGVPYEFATPPAPGVEAAMTGGGLGNFAPGEWSDDTAMAVAIARVAATGADLTTQAALDQIADGFLEWYDGGPADIGIQTSSVLSATRLRLDAGEVGLARVMIEEAAAYTAARSHSAGNGALMRTAPVALAHLDDRDELARAARLVAELTHADPLAGDSCVLWCEAIRIAVLEARFEVAAGLDLLPDDRRDRWRAWLEDALDLDRNRGERVPGERFRPNGFTVTALQAAVAAIVTTDVPQEMSARHLQLALHNAVRIGDDTDTVAAIAGGLLGARWGASAVPLSWRHAVHGWPGLDGADLVLLAARARGDALAPTYDVAELFFACVIAFRDKPAPAGTYDHRLARCAALAGAFGLQVVPAPRRDLHLVWLSPQGKPLDDHAMFQQRAMVDLLIACERAHGELISPFREFQEAPDNVIALYRRFGGSLNEFGEKGDSEGFARTLQELTLADAAAAWGISEGATVPIDEVERAVERLREQA